MSLLDLPDEILAAVAEQLVPELPVALGSYKDEFDNYPFQSGRLALLSLVQANRRLNAIVTHYLYHTICIGDLKILFKLLRTFIRAPHLAAHVRVLAVVASLFDTLDDPTESNAEPMFANITVSSSIYSHLERCFGEFEQPCEIIWSKYDAYVESNCALVLCLTTNLHTLYMHCPNWNVGSYDDLMDIFQSYHNEGVVDFLPRLSRLCLIADPEVSNPLLPDETPQVYMGSGGIKRLELFGANLFQEDVGFLADAWRDVETIHIEYACTTGAWWYRFCNEARPRLKDIDVSISPYFAERGDGGASGFNEALQLCTDTLKHLRLGIDVMPHYMSHLGPAKRLSCLTSMKTLSDLEVSVTVLFKSPTAMRRGDICDTLPPSLERLRLSEEIVWGPWSDTGGTELQVPDEEYTELIKGALLQLAFDSSSRLPRLEAVHATVNNWHWNGGGPEFDAISTVERCGSTTTVSFAPKQSRKLSASRS
ncbi:hypothetical protein MFIFM68171_02484 [Madurella fahalii]|uniref:F-box domain-containing protein n=1 Tax=Madurella fahalii TaxID=1157608 RepID=A0ABQ0G3E4_9PEZI